MGINGVVFDVVPIVVGTVVPVVVAAVIPVDSTCRNLNSKSTL